MFGSGKVIDQILDYFESGKIPDGYINGTVLPQFIQPRVIQLGEHQNRVISVQRYRFLWHTFAQVNFWPYEGGSVPPWQCLATVDEDPLPWTISWTFTSYLTTIENLHDFHEDMTRPQPSSSKSDGPELVRQCYPSP